MTHIIIDLVIVGAFLIALIVGIVKGFAKQLVGMLKGIVSLLLSFCLTALIDHFVIPTSIMTSFMQTTTGWFGNEIFTTQVASAEELTELLSNASGIWKFISSLSAKIYSAMQNLNVTTAGELFGYYTAIAIATVVIWILLIIIMKILFHLLGKLLSKITKLPVLHTIDKLLGALWAVAITYIIVVGIIMTGAEIVLANYWQTYQETFVSIIEQSTVLKILHNSNFLGKIISEALSVSLLTIGA